MNRIGAELLSTNAAGDASAACAGSPPVSCLTTCVKTGVDSADARKSVAPFSATATWTLLENAVERIVLTAPRLTHGEHAREVAAGTDPDGADAVGIDLIRFGIRPDPADRTLDVIDLRGMEMLGPKPVVAREGHESPRHEQAAEHGDAVRSLSLVALGKAAAVNPEDGWALRGAGRLLWEVDIEALHLIAAVRNVEDRFRHVGGASRRAKEPDEHAQCNDTHQPHLPYVRHREDLGLPGILLDPGFASPAPAGPTPTSCRRAQPSFCQLDEDPGVSFGREDFAGHSPQVVFRDALERSLERGGIDPQLLAPAE